MKHLFVAICLWASALFVFSQQEIINLPEPVKTGGKPLMNVFSERESNREFTGQELDKQTLSNLLWSANGFNRPDKRTVATSQNKQEMEVYVVFKDAAYWYNAKENQLKLQVSGNITEALGQPIITDNAALTLVYVADLAKASNREAGYIDTGHMCQNVYLFCASNELGTVARGSFKRPALHNALKLAENQEVTLVQPVGYPK